MLVLLSWKYLCYLEAGIDTLLIQSEVGFSDVLKAVFRTLHRNISFSIVGHSLSQGEPYANADPEGIAQSKEM